MGTCPPLYLLALAALLWVKVIAKSHLTITRWDAKSNLFGMILDQCTKTSEDVATTADVLDILECKKEAEMLRCKSGIVLTTITSIYKYCDTITAYFGLTVGV